MPKRIHISTYGCQMNDYESDRTYRLFHENEGYEWTDSPAEADLVLFNTCSIREKADQKAMSSIGFLRAAKAAKPEMVIAVGGCMAQAQGGEIQNRFSHVDIVFGTHQWNHLPELVKKAETEKRQTIETEMYGWKSYAFLPYKDSKLLHPVSELVTIQNGCDKFCTFCLVPFTRGREVSRPHGEILDEIAALAGKGVKEVTLLGQNVNAYGSDRSGEIHFSELLRRVSRTEGLQRVRFITSHPSVFTGEIADVMAGEDKVCEHLHLPIQSGSDRVLEKMNRDYTVARYRGIVADLRKKIPNLSLTTDIIVGFPTETEEDFEATLAAVEEFEFDDSFSFRFSPRPFTKAAKWDGDFVDETEADERLQRLQAAQAEIRTRKNKKLLGSVAEVLVEGEAKKGKGMLSGKTRDNRTVNFAGNKEDIGRLVNVKIEELGAYSFRGSRAA